MNIELIKVHIVLGQKLTHAFLQSCIPCEATYLAECIHLAMKLNVILHSKAVQYSSVRVQWLQTANLDCHFIKYDTVKHILDTNGAWWSPMFILLKVFLSTNIWVTTSPQTCLGHSISVIFHFLLVLSTMLLYMIAPLHACSLTALSGLLILCCLQRKSQWRVRGLINRIDKSTVV